MYSYCEATMKLPPSTDPSDFMTNAKKELAFIFGDFLMRYLIICRYAPS